jgi:hypothetical protein
LSWALLEGVAAPWGREDIVGTDEGAGVEVDGCVVIEVESYLRDLVLLGGGAGDVGVDQFLELAGAERGLELERSAQEGLGRVSIRVDFIVQEIYLWEQLERMAGVQLFKKIVGHPGPEYSPNVPRALGTIQQEK